MLTDHDAVLRCGRVEHERAHPFRVRLVHHQAAAHVRVVDDRHARRGLVRAAGQVGGLHAGPGELQRVQVARGQGGDRLGADHHPGVLDDLEHLRDAVVHVADEPALGRHVRVLAEAQLAGGGGLQAHLVLNVGDVGAIALAELAGFGVEVELRHHEQRQALGSGPSTLGTGQHQVDDVLGEVLLSRGDEAFDALDVP